MTLFSPLFLLHTLKKSRKEPRYRRDLRQRLGFAPHLDSCIWIHCVSLGETIAAKPLILKLQQQFMQTPLLITNTTATGSHTAETLLRDIDCGVFLPYDSPGAMRRFLRRTQPRVAIIMETELWPNLIDQAHKRGIPVVINNARLSARSQRGYQRIGKIARDMLQKVTAVNAQTDADGQRLIELGLPKERCHVTGNLKFDLNLPENLQADAATLQQSWNHRPTWVAASTHDGEERIILEAHQQLLKTHPDLLLVLVPRHPNRFDAVFELCQQAGLKTTRYTKNELTDEHTVLLGDTVGKLMLFYAATDITFMGGSLAPIGGHNFIESAILANPQVSGPILHNFKWVSEQLLEHQALTIAQDASEITTVIADLLDDKEKRDEQGKQAQAMAMKNAGACEKQLKQILLCVRAR
jgi:3-deoxy-D-manno-octulosonic-acid transferase